MTRKPDYSVLSEQILHEGIRFSLARVLERDPDGEQRTREIIRHPGAAVVLPLLPDGRVLMIEQHRTAVGDTLLEVPAGVLEVGEEPIETARRELEEETGYRAGTLKPLISFYPTPGITDGSKSGE